MKSKLIVYPIATILLLLVTVATGFFTYGKSADLIMEIVSDRSFFLPGDPVEIRLKLKQPDQIVSSHSLCGFMKIYVAFGTRDFEEIISSGRLQIDECEVTLPSKGNIPVQLGRRLLWNYVPQTGHLNTDAANDFMKGKVTTHYVFQEPGTYKLKGVLYFIDEKMIPPIESNEVLITVRQPEGEDLSVWEIIKGRSDIGYFLQTGDMLARGKKIERNDFQAEIEKILKSYPNSHYATNIREGLRALQTRESKRED